MIFEERPGKVFCHFALPQLVGLLFNSIYVIVDGVFIGQVLGSASMAAAGVAVPLVEVLVALSMALTSGAGVLLSGHLARGEKREANLVFNTVMRLALLIGLAIAVLGNVLIDPLADLLGATPAIHEEAVAYIRWIVTFAPFMLSNYLLGGMARNDNAPKTAMFALTLGSLSNIFLDFLFMVPLHMGIGGAALATALGPVLSIALLLPHFLPPKGSLKFERHCFAGKLVGGILVIGLPSFVMEFSIGIVTFCYNLAIGFYGFGEQGLAAYLILGYLVLIFLTLFLGMSEGLQPVFSYYAGKKDDRRAFALCRLAAIIFFVTGVAGTILCALFSRYFYLLFNPGDPQLIDFTAGVSRVYFFAFALAGENILMISFFQSEGDTRGALWIALLRSMILPPVLLLVLPRLFGANAVWLCHSLAECGTFLYVLYRIRRFTRTAGRA